MSSTEHQASEIERTDFQQQDLSVPRREVVQNRVDICPHAPTIKHKHPDEEIIYVLEGPESPGAGHWVAEQAPEEMLAALTEYMAPYGEDGGGLR